jgi:methionyl-tRNA formyltransferase
VRAVFLGTPEVAVPSLTALARISEIAAVITQPDRPKGRSKRPMPSPVKEHAESMGIGVHQPTSSREIASILSEQGRVDVAVIVAFGVLIRPEALDIPLRGFVNLHFSILPRWRGAAPVQRAIEAGDSRTGVTLMSLDRGLDTGPIYSIRSTALLPNETAGDVFDRLAETGADHLVHLLSDIVSGRALASPQVGDPSHAPKIAAQERMLDVDGPGELLIRKIHAFSPAPGATALLDGGRFKILRAAPSVEGPGAPGELALSGGRLIMGTTTQPIELVEVQAPGKRVMTGHDWARGRHGELGVLR